MTPDDGTPSGGGHRLGRRTVLRYAGIGALFAAFGAGVAWWRLAPDAAADDAVALMLGQTLPDASGKPLDLSRLRGKPLVVNFWATWCAPCVEEMPELSEMHHDLSPKGLEMIGIGIDSPSNVARFAASIKVSYPLVVAGMGGTELARRFGNQAGTLPYTVLIGRDGRVAHRILGRVKIESLRQQATALIG